MVSVMETDATPEQTLAEAERVTAALWTDYPPSPRWYYPAGGAWGAAVVAAVGGIDDPLLLLPAMAALAGLAYWYGSWYRRHRGAMPRIASAPAEFTPAIRAFVAGYVVLAAAVVVVAFALDLLVPGVVLTFVGATAGLYAYEKLYEAAVRRVEQRLG